MSQIEARYDQFISELESTLPKVDAHLAMRMMYLERKFHTVDPNVELYIKFKNGVDVQKKEFQINAKFGLSTSSSGDHVRATGRLNLEGLARLASHPDVEEITGSATPASY
jgi:hypothetical protein